jgi:AbrB family looped-hinge helix DNA binding protein
MYTVTVTQKGQIVIPVKIRKKLHIKKGTQLFVSDDGRQILIKPRTKEYIESLVGVLGGGGNLTDFLLEERAKETLANEKRMKKWIKQ